MEVVIVNPSKKLFGKKKMVEQRLVSDLNLSLQSILRKEKGL